MKGVTFNVSVPHFLLAKTAGRISDSALYGLLSGVKMSDLPEPQLPGSDWVKIEVVAGGICGSDISNLTYSASPAMEPFGSFPAVLGHEILARVIEVGPSVCRVEVGQRVVGPVRDDVFGHHAKRCGDGVVRGSTEKQRGCYQ